MHRTSFGKTWWGAQWLQALSHIDHDNRLPRGRSYVNKGAVRDLAIKDGSIEARVQGSRPQPYAVNISVPALAPKDSALSSAKIRSDMVALGKQGRPLVVVIATDNGYAVAGIAAIEYS